MQVFVSSKSIHNGSSITNRVCCVLIFHTCGAGA